MDIEAVAVRLVDVASARGQAVLRCDVTTPVERLRTEVRTVAAARGVLIRTGLVGDVLAVVLADADLWNEPVSEMRKKLVAPPEADVVG